MQNYLICLLILGLLMYPIGLYFAAKERKARENKQKENK